MEKEKTPPQIPLSPFSIQQGLSPPTSLSRAQTTVAQVALPSVPTGSLAMGPMWFEAAPPLSETLVPLFMDMKLLEEMLIPPFGPDFTGRTWSLRWQLCGVSQDRGVPESPTPPPVGLGVKRLSLLLISRSFFLSWSGALLWKWRSPSSSSFLSALTI